MLRVLLKASVARETIEEEGEGEEKALEEITSQPSRNTRTTMALSRNSLLPQQALSERHSDNPHPDDDDDKESEDDMGGEDDRFDNGGGGAGGGGGTGTGTEAWSSSSSMLSSSAISSLANSSLLQTAKRRRRTVRLLESSAEQQHEQARRAGHVAVEHFWKLALQQQQQQQQQAATATQYQYNELWHPSFLSDIASVESFLGDDPRYYDTDDGSSSHKSLLSCLSRRAKLYSFSSSYAAKSDDVSSLLGGGGGDCSVRAMRRGVRRGKREDNERQPSPHHIPLQDASRLSGGETTTHTTTTALSKTTKRGWRYGGRRRQRQQDKQRHHIKKRVDLNFLSELHSYLGPMEEGDADAWMCGVCGRAFATLESAEKHEQDHIQRVVNRLPWIIKEQQVAAAQQSVPPTAATAAGADDEPCGFPSTSATETASPPQYRSQQVFRPSTRLSRQDTLLISNHGDVPEQQEQQQQQEQQPKLLQRREGEDMVRVSFQQQQQQQQEKAPPKVLWSSSYDSTKRWTTTLEQQQQQEQQQFQNPSSSSRSPEFHHLSSDLLDEILEGENIQQEERQVGSEEEDMLILEDATSSQFQPEEEEQDVFVGELPQQQEQQSPTPLSDALIDEVLEEEKQEIDFDYNAVDYRPSPPPLDAAMERDSDVVDGYFPGHPSSPATAFGEETDLVGYIHGQPVSPTSFGGGGGVVVGQDDGYSPNGVAAPTLEDWAENEFMLERNTLVPRLRSEAQLYQSAIMDDEANDQQDGYNNHSSVPYRIDHLLGDQSMQDTEDEAPEALLLSSAVRDYVILADEALVNVCEKAHKLILSPEEIQAEHQLALLALDKYYYDDLAQRSRYRRTGRNRHRSEGPGIVGRVQNKFLDAYQLMKEGTDKKGFRDEYHARSKKNANVQDQKLVVHNQKTMYLNVMVKNGIQVVKNELERLAQERWEKAEEIDKYTRFERFRVYAHVNLVRLAGLALSSDFTPRRIAVQLSNDIYRLLTPRLRRRGVVIETEIEYRVGPYFVLAVNVLRIDWRQLLHATHRVVYLRKKRWLLEEEEKQQQQQVELNGSHPPAPQKEPSAWMQWKEYLLHVLQLTRHDIVAHILSWLYQNTHWLFYQPFCILCYYTFFGSIIRHFILSSVSDEIFYYVEERGLEMEIGIRHASVQAAFMLSALREIRADSKDHKQKEKQSKEGGGKENILGPLLGPAIVADKTLVEPPPGFEVPEHLEFLGLELDVPVGFRRLRWAFLSTESSFITEALYRVEAKYENITMGTWNRHNAYIGSAKKLVDDVKEEDFVGAEKEASYLMPKSAFVKANMCSETHFIVAYNDYCFTLKKKSLTPEVPYGSTFVAWTQFTVINLGSDSCRLQFSVEPEFPNGPPMVSRQITSGMRAGVGQLFVLIHETIAKYADEYP